MTMSRDPNPQAAEDTRRPCDGPAIPATRCSKRRQVIVGYDRNTLCQSRRVREVRAAGAVGADDRQAAGKRLSQHDAEAILP